ncbi:hypothetical protein AX16_001893, partial [Volvariella volvacea WC 439]
AGCRIPIQPIATSSTQPPSSPPSDDDMRMDIAADFVPPNDEVLDNGHATRTVNFQSRSEGEGSWSG